MALDLITMLNNLSTTFGGVELLIVAVSQIIGIVLVFNGISMYRIFATQTMSSMQKGELAAPLIRIVVGVIIIYLGSSIDVSMETIFGSTTIAQPGDLIAYQAPANDQWQTLLNVLVKYFKLLGLIAFLRGWVLLSKLGHAGGQPGNMAKGLTHIIGGILLMNIIDAMNLLSNSLGYTSS